MKNIFYANVTNSDLRYLPYRVSYTTEEGNNSCVIMWNMYKLCYISNINSYCKLVILMFIVFLTYKIICKCMYF